MTWLSLILKHTLIVSLIKSEVWSLESRVQTQHSSRRRHEMFIVGTDCFLALLRSAIAFVTDGAINISPRCGEYLLANFYGNRSEIDAACA